LDESQVARGDLVSCGVVALLVISVSRGVAVVDGQMHGNVLGVLAGLADFASGRVALFGNLRMIEHNFVAAGTAIHLTAVTILAVHGLEPRTGRVVDIDADCQLGVGIISDLGPFL